MWMVRNSGGDFAEQFVKERFVGIGWQAAGSLLGLTKDQIMTRVKEVWPEYKRMKAVVSAAQLDKFVNVMKLGDRVITYDPSTRIYHLGHISGSAEFYGDGPEPIAHRRQVNWDYQIERDSLSVPSKNSLGSTLTVFTVPEAVEEELEALHSGSEFSGKPKFDAAPTTADEEPDVEFLLADLKAKAREFIKDRIIKLDWDEMQELVAGILRAMGYRTRISPPGSDLGKDIVASPDGLGLEQPRIVVEVKHRPKQQITSPDIRSYLGGRHKNDRGLYVSTGGFSKDAKYEGDRASIPVTLMDIDDLVEVVIEYYEKLDLETRSLLPLTKIYWPS
jgi:restriction system protein